MSEKRMVRSSVSSVLASLLLVSCGGRGPTAATGGAGREAAGAARVAGGVREVDNQPPVAVFKTRPAADEGGRITGPSPLEVTFNTCQSTDPDPGDELKTTYDYEGDGVIDYSGHCRQTHVYESADGRSCSDARVCVTDRVLMDGHTICTTYPVCVGGGSGPPPGGNVPSAGWVFTQSNGASWTEPAPGTVRIGFQDSDDCGGPSGLRQSGTATLTLTLTQQRTLSVAMSGLVERFGTAGLDRGSVTVDGVPLASGASSAAPGGPCLMSPVGASGSVVLGPGTHTVVVSGDTMDGLSHVGAFWSFAVSLN